MKNMPALDALYEGVGARRTPQHVAAILVETGLAEDLPEDAVALVEDLGCSPFRSAAMAEEFFTPAAPTRAMRAAEQAMAALGGTDQVPEDVAGMATWVDQALQRLGFDDPTPHAPVRPPRRGTTTWGETTAGARGEKHGHVDIRQRLNSDELAEVFPGVSSRQYLKAVRAVAHLQQRLGVYSKEVQKYEATMFGKTRLGYTIERADFVDDAPTAIFVAYYLSRLGMRTLFTSGQQARPMDALGELLLEHALASPGCRADVIAKVLTRQSVLRRLSDEQKGDLVATYFRTLESIGQLLEDTWRDGRSRTRMVVQAGDDSTTWNMAARAWNQARTGWLNLMKDLGLSHVIEGICPGKVPALIAGDVMLWHVSEGDSDVPPDVRVWASLPVPWEVLTGEVPCTADMVREACAAAGVAPAKEGWTQPYRQGSTAETVAAPTLLHGVVVEHPALLEQLKQHR